MRGGDECEDQPIRVGRIIIGRLAVPCRIESSSRYSAGLLVAATRDLPLRFTLVDAEAERRRLVQVAWREGDRVGVHYVDVPPPAALRGG